MTRRRRLASLAIVGALFLAACTSDTPEAAPTTEATPAAATSEATRTPAPSLTATATPQPTLDDLDPPPGRILYRCDDTWCSVGSTGVEGAPLVGLPPVISFLAPSPDGTLLAYLEHDEDSSVWLGVAQVDGSAARRLTEVRPQHDPVPPFWSPDVATIYVERGPPPGTDGIGGPIDLLAVDVATGATVVLIDASEFGGGAQISRDGSTVVYTHWNDGRPSWNSIRTLPATGGEPTEHTGAAISAWSPAWLPDGRIAFMANRAGTTEPQDIFVVDPNDRSLINVSDHPAVDVVSHVGHFATSVSPNGEWIAFQSDRGGTFELYVARPNGSEVRQVSTESNGNISLPSWSPDSSFLAYSAQIDGRTGIWLTRIEDGATAYFGRGGAPLWVPEIGPFPQPAASRSGAWLVDVASGETTLLTGDRDDVWVTAATFGADGLPLVELWKDDGPLSVRYDLDGSELEAQAPSLGCTPIDEDRIAVSVPNRTAPRTFEGVRCGPLSPDGRLMTYRLDAGLVELRANIEVPSWDQWLLNIESGQRTLLRSAMRHCGGCDTGYHEGWSPIGRYVVLPELVGEVYLADTTTGETRKISEVEDPTYRRFQPQWAPRHDRLVYPAASGSTIYEDLDAGTRQELISLPWPAAFDPSARYLYSPAWQIPEARSLVTETIVYDIANAAVIRLTGDARRAELG